MFPLIPFSRSLAVKTIKVQRHENGSRFGPNYSKGKDSGWHHFLLAVSLLYYQYHQSYLGWKQRAMGGSQLQTWMRESKATPHGNPKVNNPCSRDMKDRGVLTSDAAKHAVRV